MTTSTTREGTPTSDNAMVRKGMDLVDSMSPEELNELVDYIRAVFKAKRDTANAKAAASMRAGVEVQFGDNIKPQYLRGLRGVIEEKRNTRVVVKLNNGPSGKFRSGRVVASPASLIICTPVDQ